MDHNHQDNDGRGDQPNRCSPCQTQRGDEAAREIDKIGDDDEECDLRRWYRTKDLDKRKKPVGVATWCQKILVMCPECGAMFSDFPWM